jgi:hypothetical protein
MTYVLANYWPFIIAAFIIGVPVGWVFHVPARRPPDPDGGER